MERTRNFPTVKKSERTVIGKTMDRVIVVDRPRSHLHNTAKMHLAEALAQINTQGRHFIEEEVNFHRIIGMSSCVETGQKDKIVYAQRPNRSGLTRFVVGRSEEPTSKMVVILKSVDDCQKYLLITAFLGSKAYPEPWDVRATADSFQFWASRALIWGSEPIVDGTISDACPW